MENTSGRGGFTFEPEKESLIKSGKESAYEKSGKQNPHSFYIKYQGVKGSYSGTDDKSRL
ncbi:hypothetical protein BK733_32085 [Bacillus thuringiensis serovar xiaguangiensis]|nr:hypothetical protein BK734_28815 [Bacillus thuringiensis serovar kim]OUB12217.1 hypothetical protein BK733_32085 [Bacillus thuringiensis serovar xiaguangiensis]